MTNPRKHLSRNTVIKYSPGLPQDIKPLRSCSWNQRRCFSKVILESHINTNISRLPDSFSTVPQMANWGYLGCIVRDLETTIIFRIQFHLPEVTPFTNLYDVMVRCLWNYNAWVRSFFVVCKSVSFVVIYKSCLYVSSLIKLLPVFVVSIPVICTWIASLTSRQVHASSSLPDFSARWLATRHKLGSTPPIKIRGSGVNIWLNKYSAPARQLHTSSEKRKKNRQLKLEYKRSLFHC